MAGLLKYGKQIIGLSRSQQQLAIVRYVTTRSHHRCLGANDKINIIIPDKNPKTPFSKGFFTNLFRKNDSPPTPRRHLISELLPMILDLAEKTKSEEHPPLDEFRPLMHELITRFTDERFVKLLHELARPAVSPSSPDPLVVLDEYDLRDFLDKLPTNIMHYFLDRMDCLTWVKYRHILNLDIWCVNEVDSRDVVVYADVSGIRLHRHLKVFVVGTQVVITGMDKASRAPDYLCRETPMQMVEIPRLPYCHNKATAKFLFDNLKIVLPYLDDESVVDNIPTVFRVPTSLELALKWFKEERDKIAEEREKVVEEREKVAAEREKKMLAN